LLMHFKSLKGSTPNAESIESRNYFGMILAAKSILCSCDQINK
jgi:hypothetical protein